jgi:hypothetical protein
MGPEELEKLVCPKSEYVREGNRLLLMGPRRRKWTALRRKPFSGGLSMRTPSRPPPPIERARVCVCAYVCRGWEGKGGEQRTERGRDGGRRGVMQARDAEGRCG